MHQWLVSATFISSLDWILLWRSWSCLHLRFVFLKVAISPSLLSGLSSGAIWSMCHFDYRIGPRVWMRSSTIKERSWLVVDGLVLVQLLVLGRHGFVEIDFLQVRLHWDHPARNLMLWRNYWFRSVSESVRPAVACGRWLDGCASLSVYLLDEVNIVLIDEYSFRVLLFLVPHVRTCCPLFRISAWPCLTL